MEDLEREVPHGEDDNDGDQACEDEDNDLLEPLVKREERPFGARAPKSFLPLHRRSSHASRATTASSITKAQTWFSPYSIP
jgi:hypothetical protein